MKILFFTDTYEPQVNGVVTSINLFKKQLEKKHKVHIICPSDEKLKKRKNILPLRSFPFSPYPEYKIGIPSRRVIRLVKRIKPDIVHIQSPAPIGLLGLSIAKMFGIPIVMTYHTFLTDYVHYLAKGRFLKKVNQKAIKKYTKWFFNRADIITVPSSPIKKLLKSYGIRKKIKILPTGIELKKYKKKVKKKNKIPVILHVGRVTKEKRINVVLKEFKKLKNAKLIITSDGPYKNKLKKLAKNIKNVKFTGYISEKELTKYYKTSDLFVCASKTETQGIVALEAMACGCPVIVKDALGFRDFVNNSNGLLFKRDSELHKKIKDVLKNKKLRNKLIKNGYKTTKEYSIQNCSKQLEDIYKSLLKL